jgi:hypothetical protein
MLPTTVGKLLWGWRVTKGARVNLSQCRQLLLADPTHRDAISEAAKLFSVKSPFDPFMNDNVPQ